MSQSVTAYKRTGERGFTLTELLLVLVVISVVTFMVRPNKTDFERSFFLTNQAYDIALAVREAQVYATNIRPDGVDYYVGYGVHFSIASASDALKFTLFTDKSSANHFFNVTDGVLKVYTLQGGNKITAICTVSKSNPAGGCTARTALDVTFYRPSSLACLGGLFPLSPSSRRTEICIEETDVAEARVTLTALDGTAKQIRFYSSGQISIY